MHRVMVFLTTLREFLESSTIHGLVYISTAKVGVRESGLFNDDCLQTKTGKLLWFLIVCIGFMVASYLINSSYVDWQKSPVSTTITTHPLSDLPFPTVTVCPPKGSNTALNYDLMRAHNDSMTDDDREDLKKSVVDIFIKEAQRAC